MRWTRFVAVLSCSVLRSAIGTAEEPQSTIIRNPYVVSDVAPTPAAEPIVTAPPTSTKSAWQTAATVRPMAALQPAETKPEPTPLPPARVLPQDCLQALGTVVRVRSTSEAYRGTSVVARHDRTASWTMPALKKSEPIVDPAVRQAAWIESAPVKSVAIITSPNNANREPGLLPEIVTSGREATRLTVNPYRNGETSPPTIRSGFAPTDSGNPLR